MSDLLYDVVDRVATITLNRPERKNAFTLDMVDAWTDALRAAARDPAVRAVVVTGAGDAFCSGVDLSALAAVEDTPIGRKHMLMDRIHQVAIAMADLDKPVIAAMRGVAVGAGLDMALLCDMRVAGRSIRLSEGYIKVGLVPGDGGGWLLPRLVGPAKAMELLLTGDVVGADEALRLDLVNQVYEDDSVLDRALDLARRIADAPPVQVAMIKRLVRSAESVDLRTHYDMVSSHFGVVSALADYAEAQRAFRDKRPGDYQGR
ncbi:enoyl-CoA hydratase/isomerase family protein [Nocardia jinanensis]|uniref:Enoyl-CoA hydratase n=1 Tax=Nocardia jinanensis TaxID=382504 RepID=A0A917RXZ4_9NOCA|nr:enoyl-CoA hydratase-related protein [Nocardia jinanensis]GGL41837.1 enoyl-CoA hydratase [Nocardia jinanensis]